MCFAVAVTLYSSFIIARTVHIVPARWTRFAKHRRVSPRPAPGSIFKPPAIYPFCPLPPSPAALDYCPLRAAVFLPSALRFSVLNPSPSPRLCLETDASERVDE